MSLILLRVQEEVKFGARPLGMPKFTSNLPFTCLWDDEMKAYYSTYNSKDPYYKLTGPWGDMDTVAAFREERHLSIRTPLR